MNHKYIAYIKYALYVIIFSAILIWRFSKSSQPETGAENTSENLPRESKTAGNFCDESKVKDFKENLTKSPNSLSQKNIQKITQAAKAYLESYCAVDTTLCGVLEARYHELYDTESTDIQLSLSAYVRKDAPIDDPKGGNIKVVSIFEKGDMAQYFILDDLRGEILVELAGFEGSLAHFAIWGSAFPYFHEQYGKFKLSHKKGTFTMVYECTIQ